MTTSQLSIFTDFDSNTNIDDYIRSSGALNFDSIIDIDYDAKSLAIANYLEIRRLDNAFLQIYNNFTDISIVINRLNLLENSYNVLDICLNILDSSFQEFKLDVSQNNYIIGISFDIVSQNIIDISNRLNDINIDTSFVNEYVNDVNQTFYEIMTQQPYMFNHDIISVDSNTLTLSWNYDSIIAKHENANIAKLAYSNDYMQNLPFIYKIYLDISGYIDICDNDSIDYSIYNNSWINLTSLDVIGDYNIYDFKHYDFERINYSENSVDLSNRLIYNIINNDISFAIRVYGINYSNDYPNIESRAIIFDNLHFLDVNSPSKPLFIESDVYYNSNITLKNNIDLTYYNNYSENLNSSSSAYLTEYIIDYSFNDSLASYSINRSLLNADFSYNGSFVVPIDSSSNFIVNINNLLSGSNYNHIVKVRNNFSNIYSEYSDISNSKYTLIPGNNNIGTTIDMSIKSRCYKYISNPTLNNQNVLYFNINNIDHEFMFNNSYNQQFQITHPYFVNQQLENYYYGYGKFVDNCSNLITIQLSINNIIKHTINYGGYNLINSEYFYNKNDICDNLLFIENNSLNIQDIYSSDTNYINKGYRLKGYILLKDRISNSNIINYIGDPSSNPYIMQIDYYRQNNVNNSLGSNVSYNIYIDDLSGNPNINDFSNNIYVQEVVYNMSVPSVKYFKLLLNRTYSNINSVYKYIVSNRIIANFTSSNANYNTSFNSQNIILEQTDICANGIYIYDDLCYNNISYNQSIIANSSTFNLIEKLYNLNTINGYTSNSEGININTNHYCDYNSFNKNNYNNIISSKLDLNVMHIYEISNIILLGSDLNNIVLEHYNSHNKQILSNTLLYLNSYFNNNFSLYPYINSYNYNNLDNLDISYNNTYGSNSYDLNGIIDNFNQGYKWIVFKIFKDPSNNNSYLFNNISYSIELTTDGNSIKYLPLKTMLKDNNLFTDIIVDNIFDITNNDAIMFGHVTTIASIKRYFNIKQNFNATGGLWTENSNANNISYNTSLNSKTYGSNVYSNGLYCPISNLNDDLTIYVGLKNN